MSTHYLPRFLFIHLITIKNRIVIKRNLSTNAKFHVRPFSWEYWYETNTTPIIPLLKTDPVTNQFQYQSQTAHIRKEPTQNEKTSTSSEKTVVLQLPKYKLDKIDVGPANESTISYDDAVTLYRTMYQLRRLEHNIEVLYMNRDARGFCHSYAGQEAIAVGIKTMLTPSDTVITSYRSHGWTYLMGRTLKSILAEMAQKKDGCSRGKGGSMHMYNAPYFFGGNGIVGAQVPLGTGLAFASRYQNTDSITVCIFGDGASNQGQVFESVNMAMLWKLPVIYVCENNMYGMGTHYCRVMAHSYVYMKYPRIPGIQINGMDVLTVKETAQFARDYVLKEGPILIECITYRYRGHSMNDPGLTYRTREEVDNIKQRYDPIENFETKLEEKKFITKETFSKIKDDVKKEMQQLMKEVKKMKQPEPDDLANDVYANCLERSIRGATSYATMSHKNTQKVTQLVPQKIKQTSTVKEFTNPNIECEKSLFETIKYLALNCPMLEQYVSERAAEKALRIIETTKIKKERKAAEKLLKQFDEKTIEKAKRRIKMSEDEADFLSKEEFYRDRNVDKTMKKNQKEEPKKNT